jgi:ABC-type lipoprotein release transport system permease subunit
MIDSAVKQYTGHLQVQGKDYWDNRSIDESFSLPDTTMRKLEAIPHVKLIDPRLETFALVSKGDLTKIASVVGIDPEIEDKMIGIKQHLIAGKYLTDASDGIILAEGLARNLGASVGDSIVLYGQGYHGSIAAGLLPVIGIAKFPVAKLNKSMAYISLQNAQYVYATYGLITTLSIMLDHSKNIDEVAPKVKKIVDADYRIMTWDEMMPELEQQIAADKSGGIIMLGILYMIIGFGLFGVMMMMTAERLREFGILIAVGMYRWKLAIVTTIESIFISFLGGFGGFLLSIPVIWYMHNNPIRFTGDYAKMYEPYGLEPIMPFDFSLSLFMEQSIVILILAMITAIYPMIYIHKLKPMNAIRG